MRTQAAARAGIAGWGALVFFALCAMAVPGWAQSGAATAAAGPAAVGAGAEVGWAELAVNGPSGAVLSVDGQTVGTLPLPDILRLAPGPHRFRIDRGAQRAESDILNLPAARQAELNLTLAGRSLVTVLSITPGALLLLAPALRSDASSLRQAALRAAKTEHVVLISEARQELLLREQSGLLRCIESGDCQQALARTGEVAYVLVVAPQTGGLSLKLFDLRTCDIAVQLEARCGVCGPAQRGERLAQLVKSALQQLVMRARGQLAVSSVPAGALVAVDGRMLGPTPLNLEAFVGPHKLAVTMPGHTEHLSEFTVEPGQTTTLAVPLVKRAGPVAESAPGVGGATPARPLWRWLLGGTLVGSGALLLGFGASALAQNGTCQDAAADPATCSPYYNTLGIGAGLTAGGAALIVAGTVVIAWPKAKR